MGSVGSIFPSDKFQIECPFVRNTAFETLFGQNTQLDFGHVEPRPMGWGEVKTKPDSDAIRLGFAKRFDQGVIRMGVEIIQHNINALSVRVQNIDQITHDTGEIPFGALTGNEGMALTGFRFSQHEQVPSAVALVFMVFSAWMPRTEGNGDARLLEQLEALLIETNHRAQRVMGLMIQVQNTFHFCQEHRCYLGNTPAFDLPSLNLFFFRISRTVSGAICSITPASTSC